MRTDLHFFFTQRHFANDFETRGFVRLWVFQILGLENVFVLFAMMTWSVSGIGWWGDGANELRAAAEKRPCLGTRRDFMRAKYA
jgi:hypothetical protein